MQNKTSRLNGSRFLSELVKNSGDLKSWPIVEARKLIESLDLDKREGPVLFETGFGPSGLPHIGTFGEVVRTEMVRHAFRVLTNDQIPTELICFSDDMDGLRRVPSNLDQRSQKILAEHLDMPLTSIPNPYPLGKEETFGDANNARLQSFLEEYEFDFEFKSSTYHYKNGMFDEALLRMLEVHDEVVEIVRPMLREERKKTYSPFLPICPDSKKVLQAEILDTNVSKGTITYRNPETKCEQETLVTGGNVKCQWKADWALRWYALGIDYEMAGKDLTDCVTASSKICRLLGKPAPKNYIYELFLDENGRKISKSNGNGLTVDKWLKYASQESLSLYMYQKPKSAKRLHLDVIPRAVDDYYTFLEKYQNLPAESRLDSPVWHIHSGKVPKQTIPVSFAMLLNLVSASNASDASTLWGFIARYAPGATPEKNPELDKLVGYAIKYFNDFILPVKNYKPPDEVEKAMLTDLEQALSRLGEESDSETIQTVLYDVGRNIERYKNTEKPGPDGRPGVSRTFFSTVYQLLLGQEKGPRFGTFVALYGIDETIALIRQSLSRKLSPA